jgi:uncharacterized protein (TIGR02246 family)
MSDLAADADRTSCDGIERLVARLLEALKQHDAVACAALFTDDCLLLSPYGPSAAGRDAVRATHQVWFEEGETNKRLELLEAAANGNLGDCVLAYTGDYPKPDGCYATESGRSLNILKKHTDGEWRIHVSSLNDDKPSLTPKQGDC